MNVKLVRTRRGTMVHRADCHHVQPRPATRRSGRIIVVPWVWADTQTEDVIVATIAGYGYLTCAHCKPVDENKLAAWFFLGYLKEVEQ